MITILTPTFNREKLINKAYESLINQTNKDFEWLVIDDGSVDNTKQYIEKVKKDKKINIRYIYKENGGKHTALNLGTKEAKGELILILDSDDYLDEKAVENIHKYWKKYKGTEKICGMTFLKKLDNPMFKEKTFKECISNMNDFKYNEGNLADMCEVMSTEILKKYPYPVFKGENFLSEAIVTGEISKKYNLAYIPIVIYYAEYLNDGLSKNWMRLVVNNPQGARANSLMFMSKEYKLSIRIKNCLTFGVYSFIAKKNILKDTKMKKIKVMSIFGTRPEAIKMAPLVKELESRKEIESIVSVTAQHREMLDQVLETFDIKPNYDLDIMKQGQTLSDITSRVLKGLENVIKEAKPDIVLVHGDTTTTFAGALAAFYNQVAIGHVEAGLRTYDKYSPFPEEMNRQMVDCMTDMYFAPTRLSKDNLLKQNIDENKIYITGNTAIDAMSKTVDKNYKHKELEWIKDDERMILLTAHRRENLGEPMRNIFRAIKRITDEFEDVKVIYPIHKNPKVREIAKEIFGNTNKIKLIEPLEVFDFHNFQNKSYMIMTDSGGIQEEAPSLGKPVLVLRDTTERPEGIDAGTLKLVGTNEETIYKEAKRLLTNKEEYNKMSHASNPYGDGTASKKIVDAIIDKYNN